MSEEEKVTCGVPQGSVLGPILFLIYINDLLRLEIPGEIVSFADDTAILVSSSTWEGVKDKAETALHSVLKWLHANQLHLNTTKTVCLTFSTYKDRQPHRFSIRAHKVGCADSATCNCVELQRVDHTKYLGIIIDKHLRWTEHVRSIINKTRYLLYVFRRVKNAMRREILLQLYHAFFGSVAHYGIVAWGGACGVVTELLSRLQKRLVGIIRRTKRAREPASKLKSTSLLTISQKYRLEAVMANYSEMATSYSALNRRSRGRQLQLPRCEKAVGQRCHVYAGVKLYNEMPNELKNLPVQCKNKRQVIQRWLVQQEPHTLLAVNL